MHFLKFPFFVTLLLAAILASGLSVWQMVEHQNEVSRERNHVMHHYEAIDAIQSAFISLRDEQAVRSRSATTHDHIFESDNDAPIKHLIDLLTEERTDLERRKAIYYRALLARDRQFIWVILGFSSLIAAISTIPIYFIPQSRSAAQRLSLQLVKQREAEGQVVESERRLRNMGANVDDVLFVIRRAPNMEILYTSPAYEEIWGRPVAELSENPMAFLDGLHPDDRHILALHDPPLAQFQAEFRVLRPDGTIRWIDLRTRTEFSDAEGSFITYGCGHDITACKRSEARLNAQLEIARILSEDQPEALTLQNVTSSLCHNLSWDCGCFWSFDQNNQLLTKSHLCAVQHDFQIEQCQGCVLKPGQGLPGTAAAGRGPVWVEEFDAERDRVCPCQSPSAAVGVKSAIAFPIFQDGELLGVLEFCSNSKREKDEQMIKMLVSVASQVGQFLRKRQAQTELREFQTKLKIAFDQAFQLAGFVTPAGKVLNVNKTALNFLNLKLADAVGKPLWEAPWCSHSPATQQKVRDAIQQAALGKVQRFETNIAGLLAPSTVDVSIRPVFDDTGEVSMLLVEARDITESCQERAKLGQFAVIVESTTEAIISCNLEGIIQTWNRGAENMLGFTGEEIIGKSITKIIPTNGHHEIRKLSRILRRGSVVRNYEMQYQRKDGSLIDVSVSFAPLRDESGKVVAGSSVTQDIRDRKEAEKRVKEFYSTVSHELRTPLTSIHGSLRLMEGGLAGPLTDKAGALVKIARIESDRLIRLINDILDLRKMEAGKLELKYDTVAVSPLIDRAIKAMKGMADSAQVSLESDTCDGSIWCDQDRMLQVLENVLSNAIKFSPTNSVVKLSAAENGNFIKFSVKDNGCGIAKDQIHKLFTKFQQLDSSDARPKGGTGLGLAISKEIVERHHGKIGIESEPGTGSLFWIELPAQTGVAQPQYISAATTLCERGDRSDTKCVLES